MIGAIPLPRVTAIMRTVVRIIRRQRTQSQGRKQSLFNQIDYPPCRRALHQSERQSTNRQNLIRPDLRIEGARDMIDVDDVVETAVQGIEKAGGKGRTRLLLQLTPLRRPRASSMEGIDPEGLNLDRLADARRDHPVTDLRVHPGQLDPWFAGSQQSVDVGGDAEARSARIGMQNGLEGGKQTILYQRSGSITGAARRIKKILRCDNEPKRSIYRVELGRIAGVDKSVRKHAFADRVRPSAQDRLGLGKKPTRRHQPAHGDERVATPVGEPRKSREQRAAFPTIDKITVCCDRQRTLRSLAAHQLLPDQAGRIGFCPNVEAVSRPQHDDRQAYVQIPRKDAGRSQVLDVVETALAFLDVEKVTEPLRIVEIASVRQ